MSFAKVFQLYDTHAKKLAHKKDEVIYKASDSSNTIYQVVSGTVALRQISLSGGCTILTLYGAGQCFGTLEYVNAAHRICDAVALENCVVKSLHRKDILDLVTHPDPGLNAALMGEIAKNAVRFAEFALTMTTTNPEERVLRRLYELACSHPEGAHLSQEKLGQMTGLARETVNKILKKVADNGIIKVERSRITFVSTHKLKEILNEY